ncbi:MAG: hypothetical protein M1334_03080 [Patescibacteria group bacterium]|nr:hypothetical protein [Patescibacteria group bacterium]
MTDKQIKNFVYEYAKSSIPSTLDNRTWVENYFKQAEKIRAYLKPGAKILDWGGSHGHVSFILEQFGFNPTLYEYAKAEGA